MRGGGLEDGRHLGRGVGSGRVRTGIGDLPRPDARVERRVGPRAGPRAPAGGARRHESRHASEPHDLHLTFPRTTNHEPAQTTFAFEMTIGFTGTFSCMPEVRVGAAAIASTTSMPDTTFPNTQ